MSYTIQKLATLSGVTVRTLHHYDEVGLLSPTRKKNGYRIYDEHDLLKLQQIMFFRELDFPLLEIRKILSSEKFDEKRALLDHKKLIEAKRRRLAGLVRTIDKTIRRINKETNMKDEELYKAFKEHDEKYADEAKQRWGKTDAYKQSQARVAKMSKADMADVQKKADALMKELVENMKFGPKSPEVQKLISQHYANLRIFYEPSLEMYRGLGNMYVDDPRFTAYYEKYAKNLAAFMRDAMHFYCDTQPS